MYVYIYIYIYHVGSRVMFQGWPEAHMALAAWGDDPR